MVERPDAGDAGNAGDAGKVSEDADDVGGDALSGGARPGRPGTFWGPSVWAGVRAGNAGNAEEELGVQPNTSAVYPTGRVALALQAPGHTAQLDWVGSGCVVLRCVLLHYMVLFVCACV